MDVFSFGEVAVSFREALINFSGRGLALPADWRFVGVATPFRGPVAKVPWKRCRPCRKAGNLFFDGFDRMECRFLEESGWGDIFDTGHIHHIYHGILFIRN